MGLNEYINTVALNILNSFSYSVKKYAGLDLPTIVKELTSVKNIHNELVSMYHPTIDKCIEDFWEEGSSVEEAVNYLFPKYSLLVNSQCEVM